MDVGSKLEELNLTPDEMNRFSKAFKDEKFREMLREYAEEISNPENKKKYEEEITLMEQERGMAIKFVHPKPERVLKTSLDGKQKCFINICSNDLIGKPECRAERGTDGRVGQQWSLPYSLTPGRPDLDSKGNKYMIYDVIFHPDALYIAGKNDRFMKLVESTALQGVQDQFKVKLDEKNVKVLKMKYKGVPNATVIRKPVPGHPGKEKHAEPNDLLSFPYPYDNNQSRSDKTQEGPKPKNCEQNQTKVAQNQAHLGNRPKPTEPRYTVKYRSYIDLQDYRCSRDSAPDPRPKEIVITIDLPLLNSAEKADLNVTEKCIVLESLKPSYRLELPLAYPVDENKGGAKFNKVKKQLTITLPVLPAKNPLKIEANSQQLVSDVISGENSSDHGDNITQSGDIGGGQVPASELSEQPECHPLDSSAVASSSPANTNGFELTERAIEEAEEYLSCSSSCESGCHTDTSKHEDLHRKEAVPSAEHAEAGADCEENFNEEEEADISHQSPDNAQDEKSKAASAIPSNLGCGVQTGTCSHGAMYEGPCCELGPEPCSAPRSALARERRSQRSLPLGDVARDQGGQVLSEIRESQPGPSRGLSPTAKGGDCTETEKFSGAVGEAEEERVELDEDDVPFDNQPLPVVLREINGDEVISDHTTSAAFTFQNSLLYELD
ncbi:protein kintoun [Anguilla anguilla]|uniref:protein kintoun n=1 Tax=Anguilla anguilla TaxID=7936 RepID=UPI0015AC1C7A|nr:protein kintoun [Anguilla anguilla]